MMTNSFLLVTNCLDTDTDNIFKKIFSHAIPYSMLKYLLLWNHTKWHLCFIGLKKPRIDSMEKIILRRIFSPQCFFIKMTSKSLEYFLKHF